MMFSFGDCVSVHIRKPLQQQQQNKMIIIGQHNEQEERKKADDKSWPSIRRT
jgi:hypothetical protein